MQRRLVQIGIAGAAVFVVTLTILWFVFVHAPSPEEVCTHKIDLTYAESGQAKQAVDTLVKSLEKQCVLAEKDRIRLRGKIKYATHARCVVAATNLDEAERC